MKKMILGLTTLCILQACQKAPDTITTSTETETTGNTTQEVIVDKDAGGSLSLANIVVRPGANNAMVFTVEIARTVDEKAVGLQGRDNIPDKHGMWFVFDADVQDPFWMKDTAIPLDIIFVGSDYKIVDIIPSTVPNTEILLVPRSRYRFALEVKAGTADAHNIKAGDLLEFRVGPQ